MPALWPVAVGAYFPLHTLTDAQALLQRSWPQSVSALLVQQVEEPAEERRLAKGHTGPDRDRRRGVARGPPAI